MALAVLAVVGLVAAVAGVAAMTVARPVSTVTATASLGSSAPVAVTAPGVLESRSGPVGVRATGSGRVVLAVGRQADVTAWLDSTAHTTITRLATATTLATRSASGRASTPDPAGSDLWLQRATGSGSAHLTYRPAAVPELLLVASDGSGPAPRSLSLAWQERQTPAWALPLLVAGAVVALAALVARAASGRRPQRPGRRRAEPVSAVGERR